MTTTSLRISIMVICAIVCASHPCISAPQGVSTPEAKLPTTAAELDSWLVGTDWHMYYRWENESYDVVLRFHSDGKVLCLNDAREWREDRAPKSRNYRALGSRNVQFGLQTWVVTFDSKMKTFAGTCKQLEGVRCRGKRVLPKPTVK